MSYWPLSRTVRSARGTLPRRDVPSTLLPLDNSSFLTGRARQVPDVDMSHV